MTTKLLKISEIRKFSKNYFAQKSVKNQAFALCFRAWFVVHFPSQILSTLPNRLNFEQCIYKPVEYLPYTPLPPILPTPIQLSEIGAFVNEHLDEFFFQKDEEWRGENEFRVISNQIESLDINGAVTCVYVTSACSQVCKFVEQLTNGLPVMYFHYTENGNIRVPILSDTIKYRKAYTKDIRTNVPIDMTGYSLVNI